MTNHVHFIAVPKREDSLAKAVGRTHWLYTMSYQSVGRAAHTIMLDAAVARNRRDLTADYADRRG